MTQGASLFSYETSIKDFLKFILPIFSTTAISWKTKCQQQELSLVRVLSRLIKKGNSNIRYYYY